MNRKCKICGYVFKDRDEQICPECFTAREEDISCESFSHEDHCEDSYTHFKEMESKPEYFDETFEDDNSFIEENLREEKHDSFARTEQKQADSVSMGNTYSTKTENKTFTTNTRTYTTNNNSANTRTAANSKTNYTFTVNNSNQNKAKKNNNGCLIFIILFIIFWMIPGGCSAFLS